MHYEMELDGIVNCSYSLSMVILLTEEENLQGMNEA